MGRVENFLKAIEIEEELSDKRLKYCLKQLHKVRRLARKSPDRVFSVEVAEFLRRLGLLLVDLPTTKTDEK